MNVCKRKVYMKKPVAREKERMQREQELINREFFKESCRAAFFERTLVGFDELRKIFTNDTFTLTEGFQLVSENAR